MREAFPQSQTSVTPDLEMWNQIQVVGARKVADHLEVSRVMCNVSYVMCHVSCLESDV